MNCEKCNNSEMVKTMFNHIPGEGYTTLWQFQCPECDYKFLKVA